ncbi:MAG: DUF4446 family protein [Chloroflexi bacterium]|jgi:hypothetical protein|nr:DUF4446 family protein [Chloroflexota bacterium]
MLPQSLMLVCLAAALLGAAALVLALVAIVRQRRFFARYDRVFAHTDEQGLHDALETYVAQVTTALDQIQHGVNQVEAFGAQVSGCVQRLGMVRFNPFDDTGGDQSFALALADARGQGVVISSLHARGLTRIYAKPLSHWASPYQLTTEEQQAIERARNSSNDTLLAGQGAGVRAVAESVGGNG